MKRLLLLLFASLTLLCVPAMAAQEVAVTVPGFDITLNGQKFDNINSRYPFIVYNDVTYMPMTPDIAGFLGLKTRYDGIVHLGRIDRYVFFVGSSGQRTEELTTEKAAVPNDKAFYTASVADYGVAVNEIRSQFFFYYSGGEPSPVLDFRGVTYIPLTWDFVRERFGWDYSFDPRGGLIIDSREAFRPVLDEDLIYTDNSLPSYVYYVYSDDRYVGFRSAEPYVLVLGERGREEETTPIDGVFLNGYENGRYAHGLDIWRWNAQNSHYFSAVLPALEGDILSVRVLTFDSNVYDIKVDIEKRQVVSVKMVPFEER